MVGREGGYIPTEMYTPCFHILYSANSSIDLKLKEAFYISKNKPDLNKQLHHFNTFLTL